MIKRDNAMSVHTRCQVMKEVVQLTVLRVDCFKAETMGRAIIGRAVRVAAAAVRRAVVKAREAIVKVSECVKQRRKKEGKEIGCL